MISVDVRPRGPCLPERRADGSLQHRPRLATLRLSTHHLATHRLPTRRLATYRLHPQPRPLRPKAQPRRVCGLPVCPRQTYRRALAESA